MLHVISLFINIHLFHKIPIAFVKKIEVIVFIKYLDFARAFFSNFTAKLPLHMGINDYFINIIEGEQSLLG